MLTGVRMKARQIKTLLTGLLFANLAAFALVVGGLFWGITPHVAPLDPSLVLPTATRIPASRTPNPSTTPIPPPTLRATITAWPTHSPMPSMTSLALATTLPLPQEWREWPVASELSDKAKIILKNARRNPGIDITAFSKVGDCQLTSSTFLGGYARGEYKIPPGFEATVQWFAKSMQSESITGQRGLAINSVNNPMFGYAAGHTQCYEDETPLACELRLNRPVIVLVGMGTNWAPNYEASFEKHLRNIVDQILETGALPILATKADNVEKNWKLNAAIATVAYDYDLPVVNVWKSVQDTPNQGLDSKDNIHLNYYGLKRRNESWLIMLQQVYLMLKD